MNSSTSSLDLGTAHRAPLAPRALVILLLVTPALFFAFGLFAQNAPTITTQPASQTVLPGANVAFNVVVQGSGPFAYQWRLNGTNRANRLITTVAGTGGMVTGTVTPAMTSRRPPLIFLNLPGWLWMARGTSSSPMPMTTASAGSAPMASSPRWRGAMRRPLPETAGRRLTWCLTLPPVWQWDGLGNLFIADVNNQRIRKVGTNGIIGTVVGFGAVGGFGDGGKAAFAGLNYPFGVAVDGAGNVFIADMDNQHRQSGYKFNNHQGSGNQQLRDFK